MPIEETFRRWTEPSSNTEQEKQERTERMVRDAIDNHPAFDNCRLEIYAKGSYANNTNVRADSDVDIAVECVECEYWEESNPGDRKIATGPYDGNWTPDLLRRELASALIDCFGDQVDTSGTTAIAIHSGTARIDADVVPCFSYRFYMAGGDSRAGTKIFKANRGEVVNYPRQQLENGAAKNKRTNYAYKKAVRLLKRIENVLVTQGKIKPLPSYFVECLAYNCLDDTFLYETWVEVAKSALRKIWTDCQGDEPEDVSKRWVEANNCFFLFHPDQKWNRADARNFAQAAWNYFGF